MLYALLLDEDEHGAMQSADAVGAIGVEGMDVADAVRQSVHRRACASDAVAGSEFARSRPSLVSVESTCGVRGVVGLRCVVAPWAKRCSNVHIHLNPVSDRN